MIDYTSFLQHSDTQSMQNICSFSYLSHALEQSATGHQGLVSTPSYHKDHRVLSIKLCTTDLYFLQPISD